MFLRTLLSIRRATLEASASTCIMSAAPSASNSSSPAPYQAAAAPVARSLVGADSEPTKFSAFGAGIKEIHNVPMSVIIRPLPSLLDEEKVQAFVREVERGDEFTPIEVLRVRSPVNPDQSYYFSLGGCHRYEAHKRLGRETIRGKVIEVPASVMKMHLGSSAPF